MLESTAWQTVRDLSLISSGDSVCVAVSGGPDSISLLHFIYISKETLGISKLYACHFNHNLRGAESDRDEAFVRDFCSGKGIELFAESGHMDKISLPSGESEESMARKLRYNFFEKVHNSNGALIAVAHNMNDCAETTLFNIVRGTGINGVKGISAKRDFYIRPFIKVTRSEILDYCSRNRLDFVTDSTNSSDEYSRNMLRNQVFPYLKIINSRAVENFSRLSDDAGEIFLLIKNLASNLCDEASTGNNVYIIEKLKKAASPVVRQFISVILTKFNIEVNRACIDTVYDIIDGRRKKFTVGINLTVFSYDGRLYFISNQTAPKSIENVAVNNFVNGYHFDIEMEYNTPCDFLNSIDYSSISGHLFFRSRRTGDFFKPAVRGQTKTVKKIFQELRIPEQQRDEYLFLCDDDGIVWIPGFGVGDRVKTNKDTIKYFHIKYI